MQDFAWVLREIEKKELWFLYLHDLGIWKPSTETYLGIDSSSFQKKNLFVVLTKTTLITKVKNLVADH